MRDGTLLSVVVPCYNEEEVIATTHRRLSAALSQLAGLDFEIVYVDDGSRDGTALILEGLAAADESVRIVKLSRNFGHQIAMTAGLEHTSGDAVVVIDADLQDPPEVIPELVARWRDGNDVVYAVRTDREGESAFKLATAKGFYRLLNMLSDTEVPVDTGDFRLMDRRAVDALLTMPEKDRFVRGMVSWIGFQQVAVPYARARREAGVSKYPLLKMLAFALDGVVSFSFAPLRLATWLGFAASGLAALGIVYTLVVWIVGSTVHGWTTLSVAVLALGGLQLISLGIMGEYIGRIYREVKHRPLYLVDKRLGFESEPDPDEARSQNVV